MCCRVEHYFIQAKWSLDDTQLIKNDLEIFWINVYYYLTTRKIKNKTTFIQNSNFDLFSSFTCISQNYKIWY